MSGLALPWKLIHHRETEAQSTEEKTAEPLNGKTEDAATCEMFRAMRFGWLVGCEIISLCLCGSVVSVSVLQVSDDNQNKPAKTRRSPGEKAAPRSEWGRILFQRKGPAAPAARTGPGLDVMRLSQQCVSLAPAAVLRRVGIQPVRVAVTAPHVVLPFGRTCQRLDSKPA